MAVPDEGRGRRCLQKVSKVHPRDHMSSWAQWSNCLGDQETIRSLPDFSLSTWHTWSIFLWGRGYLLKVNIFIRIYLMRRKNTNWFTLDRNFGRTEYQGYKKSRNQESNRNIWQPPMYSLDDLDRWSFESVHFHARIKLLGVTFDCLWQVTFLPL